MSLVRAAWERRPEGPAYLLPSVTLLYLAGQCAFFGTHLPPLDPRNSEDFPRVPMVSGPESGFTFNSDPTCDLGGELVAAGNEPSIQQRTYEGRSDPVTFTIWGGPKVTPSTVIDLCMTGSGTAKMRKIFNLNEMGGVFKQEHDLPRRVGETES